MYSVNFYEELKERAAEIMTAQPRSFTLRLEPLGRKESIRLTRFIERSGYMLENYGKSSVATFTAR